MAAESNAKAMPPADLEEFGYLTIPKVSPNELYAQEGGGEKLKRKLKENPFVPIGE